MKSLFSVRKRAPWIVIGATLILATAASFPCSASTFTLKVSDVSLGLGLLYPGQTSTVTYTLAGPAMAVTGGLTSVKVELLDGSTVAKSLLIPAGQPGAVVGVNSVPIAWADAPVGGPFTVRVTAVGGPISVTDMLRVSNPADPNQQFYGPRGVDVNRNAGSPAFGRIYVTEGTPGATSKRMTKDGLYLLNPDLTPAYPDVRMGSADIGALGPWTTSTHSPFRVYVDKSSTVWVTDAADGHPAVFYTDADASTATTLMEYPFPAGGSKSAVGLVKDSLGQEVFGDTTSIWVEGAGAADRKVFLAVQEMAPVDAIWSYSIPEGTHNVVQVPTLVADPIWAGTTWYNDFVRDASGNTYAVNFSTDTAFKFDASGLQNAALPLGVAAGVGATGICIDEARDVILICTTDGRVLKTNKAFDAVTPIITGMGATCRDVAMDADGWVYVANETDKALHVYAPPGDYTSADTAAAAAQTLTVKSVPLAGDIAPIGPTGINVGTNGNRFGDGKVDLLDAVQSLRVSAGLQTMP